MNLDSKQQLHEAKESVDGQPDTAFRSAVHDLRSPLQTLFSSIDALDSHRLHPEAQQALLRIRRSTQALDAQLDDLVALLHIRSGTLGSKPVSFEVGALLEELKEAAAPLAVENEPRLVLELPDHPIFAFADAAMIRQALARIVRVLAKVTVQGEVRLSVDSSNSALPALTFRARSAVRGGLTAQLTERLFLVQMIATSLGGKFESFEEPDRRSCFVLTIPVHVEDPDAVPVSRI